MECLSKFTRYNSVRPLATLSYASDLYNGSSIVSRYSISLTVIIHIVDTYFDQQRVVFSYHHWLVLFCCM